jgi:hypothetical protein
MYRSTSALCGDEWSASRHGTFTLGTHSIGGWVGPRADMDDSAVGTATGYGLGWSLSPGKGKIFLLSTLYRPVLGPAQLLIQWVAGALSPEVIMRLGPEADQSFKLVLRLRMRGSIHPLHHTSS